eukprot:1118556-Amphidinium_carterae.1
MMGTEHRTSRLGSRTKEKPMPSYKAPLLDRLVQVRRRRRSNICLDPLEGGAVPAIRSGLVLNSSGFGMESPRAMPSDDKGDLYPNSEWTPRAFFPRSPRRTARSCRRPTRCRWMNIIVACLKWLTVGTPSVVFAQELR